jgi:plasmid stabilization system protein ParE
MARPLYTPRALRLIDEATDFSLQKFGYDRTLQYVADMEAEFLKIARDHKKSLPKKAVMR